MSQCRVGTEHQPFIGHIHYLIIQHLFLIHNWAYLEPIDRTLLPMLPFHGVDISGKFNLDGSSHLILSGGEHEIEDISQGEHSMLEHIGKGDKLAPLPYVAVADKTILEVESGYEIFQRSCLCRIGYRKLDDIETIVNLELIIFTHR